MAKGTICHIALSKKRILSRQLEAAASNFIEIFTFM
jgi:hypothetical protein